MWSPVVRGVSIGVISELSRMIGDAAAAVGGVVGEGRALRIRRRSSMQR